MGSTDLQYRIDPPASGAAAPASIKPPATIGRYFAAHDRRGELIDNQADGVRLFRACLDDLPTHTLAAIVAAHKGQDQIVAASRAALDLEISGLLQTVDSLLFVAPSPPDSATSERVSRLSRMLQDLAGLKSDLA
jgi:hypothetical protein